MDRKKVKLIEKQLLRKNYLTTCSVIKALENEDLFSSLTAYSQLDLSKQDDFKRLISDDFIDDLTFSFLVRLTDEEKDLLLEHLKSPKGSLF